MKALFLLLMCCLATPILAQSPGSSSANEQQYATALEYVYTKDYKKALPILENLFKKVPNSQIAQTLLNVYLALLQQPSLSEKEQNIVVNGLSKLLESSLLPENDSQKLLQLFFQQAFATGDFSFIEKPLDLYLQKNKYSIVANGMRGNIVAMKLIQKQQRQEPVDPHELIRYNFFVANSHPTNPAENYYVSQAREFMALAYQALGDRRRALFYRRLAYLIHQQSGNLLSGEIDLLNFPYAAKLLGTLNINNLNQDQRELYLGILFADGSKESIRLMDAMLSAKKTPLSAYEEALSLYRRGLTTRSMLALEATANTPLRRETPWFYLYLRYKLLKRLQLHDEIQPVAASLGGMAYLVGKNEMALSYFDDIDENEKGEKGYLTAMIYLRERNYPKAVENLRKHLQFTNSRYYDEVLDNLISIGLDQGQEAMVRRYLNLYEKRNGNTPYVQIIRAKMAVKAGRYDEAVALEEQALDALPLPHQITLSFDLASFYSSQWLQADRDKQILQDRMRLYNMGVFQLLIANADKIQNVDKIKRDGFNNYVYNAALSAEKDLNMDMVRASSSYSRATSSRPFTQCHAAR